MDHFGLKRMQKTSTKTLYEYWNGIRGSRSAPDRKDIDPTRIREALANTFILELDEDGNAKSSYGMKPDKLLTGRINPDGRVKLSFRDNGFVVAFEGELHTNHILGHSSVTGDRTCDIAWDLWRG